MTPAVAKVVGRLAADLLQQSMLQILQERFSIQPQKKDRHNRFVKRDEIQSRTLEADEPQAHPMTDDGSSVESFESEGGALSDGPQMRNKSHLFSN